MDVPDLAAEGSEQQKRSKVSTMEQRRKFEELRERRLQLQKAQDVANSRKKKTRKRGKKGDDLHPETACGASEPHEEHLCTEEATESTDTAAEFGSEQRHVFAVNAGCGTAEEASVSQSSGAGGGEGNLDIVRSTTEKTPSGIVAIPAKTPVVSPLKTKRKKLQWGMEVKERWERKGNM